MTVCHDLRLSFCFVPVIALMRLDHVAIRIVNANHSSDAIAPVDRVPDCVAAFGLPYERRMAAHRKSDRRRDDLFAVGLRKGT
jgi:hypothetical protein